MGWEEDDKTTVRVQPHLHRIAPWRKEGGKPTWPVGMLQGAQPQLVSLLLPHVFYNEHVILPRLNEKEKKRRFEEVH